MTRAKCDYCDQPGTALVGESDEVIVCWNHIPNGLGDFAQARDEADIAEFQHNAVEIARKADIAEARAEGAEAAIERARDVLDGWVHDGPDDPAMHLLIRRVRKALDGVA